MGLGLRVGLGLGKRVGGGVGVVLWVWVVVWLGDWVGDRFKVGCGLGFGYVVEVGDGHRKVVVV